MKRIYLIVLLALSISMIFSCSDTTEPEPEEQVIMPLVIGNTWEYEYQEVWFGIYADSLRINVYKDTVFKEVTYRRIVEYEGFLLAVYYYGVSIWEEDYFYLYRNEDLGLICYGDVDEDDGEISFYSEPHLIALFPAEVGDLWKQYSNSPYIYECVAINEQVTVPAGTFNCYVYEGARISDGELVFIYYYALNIGLIGYKRYRGESYEGYEIPIEYQCFWERKLLSYSLN